LYNAALREPNISIETGARITSCDVGPKASIEVEGRKEGPFDLLLVADGRDSVRKSIEGAVAHESPYPYGCLWTILPDHDGTFTSSPVLQQKLHSTKTMLGFMPTGRTHAMSLDDPKLVSLFWSLKIDSVAQARQEGLDAWKAKIISLEPKSEGLLQGLTNFDQLIPAAYSDTFMPRLYLNESCAFLGDCAHATSPQLGQGTQTCLLQFVTTLSCLSFARN
jgi:2-polyprenyl-6-methoxyphenol hydroxylase-like FAD-dependent oxidoreductase